MLQIGSTDNCFYRRSTQGAKVSFNEKRVRHIHHNPGFLKQVRWESSHLIAAALEHTLFFQECKGVAYWMSRDQRVQDNWALIYAQKLAKENRLS